MSTQTEAVLENNLIKKLENEGYEYVDIADENELNSNFKYQIEKFNNCSLSDDEFERILSYLNQGSIYDKAEKLRDKYLIERDDESFHISFLNKKDWCKNIFQVSNQITMVGSHQNRYDVTLLINGLPLVQVELKRRGLPIKEAFNQIKRYKRHSFTGLFNYVQIFVISNGVSTKYFSNGDKEIDFAFTFYWKDEENNNIVGIDEFAETFLEKCNLAKIISRYMVLNESSRTLMVLRAYQVYAVEAILNQALEVKQNGYVWHTTGSGKTLTSFKASKILAEEESIDKVIFVVDRRDLDIQTTKEFQSFCPDCVNQTENTGALVENLNSEKHKMLVTTIQKLNNAVTKKKKQIDSVKDKNIIFIYDECHRSQFGKMHGNIEDFFSNSLSFGFTGTPIFKDNSNGEKTTKSIFNKRLHTYLIKDAIRDDNVLGFSADYYNTVTMKKEVEDSEVSNIDTKEVLENEKRLSKIVDNIIESYDAKTRNREFNAIFTVSQGGVIHDYYRLFKEKDHDLKIATIFTFKANEDIDEDKAHSRDLLESYIRDYNKIFGTNFSVDTFKEYYADVSKRMKDREIDLLLVVNMFLTGFDSPMLNTLFVDKNLEYHTLLQAFSRTNRVYNPRKSQGNIVSYRNIKRNVDEAIALFSDGSPIEDVIIPSYDFFVKEFNLVLVKFYKVAETVDEARKLERESDKERYVIGFRELMRIKNKLDIFTEFSFDDLQITEQDFNDFFSVYLDIYNDKPKDEGAISILNDIDFELELVRNDKINVDYILDLLENFDLNGDNSREKERIIKLMSQTESLRSKIDLIEKFIDNNLPKLEKNVGVRVEFDNFMKDEESNATKQIIAEEKLDANLFKEVLDKYRFSEKIDNDLIKKSFNEKYKFREKKSKVELIKDKIIALVERFTY